MIDGMDTDCSDDNPGEPYDCGSLGRDSSAVSTSQREQSQREIIYYMYIPYFQTTSRTFFHPFFRFATYTQVRLIY